MARRRNTATKYLYAVTGGFTTSTPLKGVFATLAEAKAAAYLLTQEGERGRNTGSRASVYRVPLGTLDVSAERSSGSWLFYKGAVDVGSMEKEYLGYNIEWVDAATGKRTRYTAT
jgi:hypothetical protein